MRVLALLGSVSLALVAYSFPTATTSAVQAVSGTVTDAKGAALPGAAVTLTAKGGWIQSATTDARGRFSFSGVPVGRATLTVSLAGFTVVTRTLKVDTDRPPVLRIAMTAAAMESPPTSANQVAPPPPAQPRTMDFVIGGVAGGTTGGLGPGSGPHGYRGRREPWNTEAYDRIDDNAFRRALDHPLSTFSIDVDTASYSNVRRFLNAGALPPADAVRTEELINYFKFDYPAPSGSDPFSVTTEVAACPWNGRHKLALIGLQTRRIETTESMPARNLVFLLDVSGSMTPADKLPLVRTAMRMLVDTLTARDRVAIVVYAGASGLVLPSTPGDRKAIIHDAIQNLEAGGSTNGAAGLRLAYEIAAANFVRNGINRVILATDGDFNVGVTSQGELVRMMEEKREQGVFLTILGVGTENLKDSTMEKLADKGNGNYAYLDSLHEARRVLVAEAGATLVTVAKDVKIQVEFNPAAVNAYRLIGYENRLLHSEDFNNDRKDAGEIGAGHSVTALYEIVPAGVEIDLSKVDPLKYQRPAAGAEAPASELMTVKLRYKEPHGDVSRLMTVQVANRAAGPSARLGFAAAVAEFGMLLRTSQHRGEATWRSAIDLARQHRGVDPDGYRAEFIKLVDLAGALGEQRTTTASR
ncbi:MAG: YfbK domain-containing protein [Vicinamibacterales bacterium]